MRPSPQITLKRMGSSSSGSDLGSTDIPSCLSSSLPSPIWEESPRLFPPCKQSIGVGSRGSQPSLLARPGMGGGGGWSAATTPAATTPCSASGKAWTEIYNSPRLPRTIAGGGLLGYLLPCGSPHPTGTMAGAEGCFW